MNYALILEDQKDISVWLGEILTEAFGQIDIVRAFNLQHARQCLRGYPFWLALIDLNLPDGSGIDFIIDLKRENPAAYGVVVTIFGDDDHIFGALQAGAQGYLLKEQPKDKLIQSLQGILRDEPPISPAIARRILRFFQQQQNLVSVTGSSVMLTRREVEVLTLMAKGITRRETAKLLDIKDSTAAGYIKSIYQKLGISSRAEAVVEASRMGLIDVQRMR